MLTASTYTVVTMFGLISVSSLLLLRAALRFDKRAHRMGRIAGIIIPWVGIALDAAYHVMIDLGYAVPALVHSMVSPIVLVGVVILLATTKRAS